MGISPTPQNSSAISRTAKSSDRDHQSWGILLIHRCVVGSSHKISWPCLDFHGSISAGTKSRIEDQKLRHTSPHHAWGRLSQSEKVCFKQRLTTSLISVSVQTLKCSQQRSTLAGRRRSFTEFSPTSTTYPSRLFLPFLVVVLFTFLESQMGQRMCLLRHVFQPILLWACTPPKPFI